jgi:hypothetical protein
MKVRRHELEHTCLCRDAVLERRASLIRRKSESRHRAATVVNRNSKSEFYPELRSLIAQLLFCDRGGSRWQINSPAERLNSLKRLYDDGIDGLIVAA